MSKFEPDKHLITVGKNRDGSARQYLPVAWRIVWFRQDNPDGTITTDLAAIGDVFYVRARVILAGVEIASGLATVRQAGEREQTWAGREIEKAETAAIGRALAVAGYGTQFTDEDEGENLADSPLENLKRAELPAGNGEAEKPMAEPQKIRQARIIAAGMKMPHYQKQQKHIEATLKLLVNEGVFQKGAPADAVIGYLSTYGMLRDKGKSQEDAIAELRTFEPF